MDDFTTETAAALRCHRVEPTLADILEHIVENNLTYTVELVYGDDGPEHVATIRDRSRRPRILALGNSIDPGEALACALVTVLDGQARRVQDRAVTPIRELRYVPAVQYP